MFLEVIARVIFLVGSRPLLQSPFYLIAEFVIEDATASSFIVDGESLRYVFCEFPRGSSVAFRIHARICFLAVVAWCQTCVVVNTLRTFAASVSFGFRMSQTIRNSTIDSVYYETNTVQLRNVSAVSMLSSERFLPYQPALDRATCFRTGRKLPIRL